MMTSLLLVCCSLAAWQNAGVSGDAQISNTCGDSRIVIKTTERLAGAIDSLTWNGKEFIDSFDHGRQLQSASNFDAGGPFVPETFNPTEAGSRFDGRGPRSTSKLLRLEAAGNRLSTTTQMAFWLRPGEKSNGEFARNTTPVSKHLLRKEVTIGLPGLPHVIEYVTTFTLPEGEEHHYAQFEAVTGYMPAEFSRFYTYDARRDALIELSDGPGEQSLPVVFATESGEYAMGVYSPDQPSKGFEHAGYGRFRFAAQKVVKWNCVFRLRRSDEPLGPGDYTFRNRVVVGTLEDIRATLKKMIALDS